VTHGSKLRDLAQSQTLPCALALGSGGAAVAFSAVHAPLALLALLPALGALGLAARNDLRTERLARRGLALTGAREDNGSALSTLERDMDGIETLIGSIEQRLEYRHPVSGLPTREPLLAAIEQAIRQGSRGVLGVVSLLDFERLAAFDPALADHMLRTMVERALKMLGERRLVAQVDRSRFAIWYEADIAADAACAQLDAVGYALGGPVPLGDREVLPEVRIGTAQAPADGTTPARLLAHAIATLSLGVAEIVADPVEAARERYAMEQDLRRAIDRGELELHYQPLIDANEGRVCGAEALLRWHHPVQGQIPPGRFIPVVESAGLADEIGLWVLNAACREARNWQRAGLDGLRVAVNVSGHQLERAELPAMVERTLGRHSLGSEALEVELTETVAAGDAERAAMLFDRLRGLGVAIAIDDFGTGYSSFSSLRSLSFDKIKIDREFVSMVDERRDSQAICRAIIALAQGLGTRVLAEGVERAQEVAWLRRNGCHHFQGYYFSRPLEACAFQAFVRDGARLARLLSPAPLAGPQPERLRA
jgi:EAL domain-containing protein (putative c-di-GMP-specific phosphodiesterase class I)/GGDEF domain-containing protein